MRSLRVLSIAALAVAAGCVLPPPPPPPPPPPTTTTTTPPPPPPPRFGGDFDGDGKADLVWIHLDAGIWYRGAPPDAEVLFVGQERDVPVPGDYDGDGRTDIVVVRDGRWLRSDGTVLADFPPPGGVGLRSAEPVPADYDGDSRAEPAWFRNQDATWWTDGAAPVTFGRGPTDLTGDLVSRLHCRLDYDFPVPADYDGDGRADLSVYSPRTGLWSTRSSADGITSAVVLRTPFVGPQFPAPADYEGVGHAQRALFDHHGWLIEGHAAVEPPSVPAGGVLISAVADYDGDGRLDRSHLDIRTGGPSAIWHLRGTAEPLELPGTPGPGIAAPANQLILFHIGRFTVVENNGATPC